MNKTIRISAIVVLAQAFMACSKTELFDSAVIEKDQKATFSENFEKKYGAIDPNQTWDFTKGIKLGTRAGGITTETIEGLDFGFDAEGNMTKNKALFDDVSINLPSKSRPKEDPSMLVAPGSSFVIYPISAQARWWHTLYIKVGNNEPVAIYSKDWGDVYANAPIVPIYCNGMDVVAGNGKKVNMSGLKVNAPIGTPIEIYLDDLKTAGGRAITTLPTSKPGTSNGQAILVETNYKPEGINIPEDATITYLGIEDNSGSDSDWDYNDVVLAIIGTDPLGETPITETEYIVSTNETKRYMVEDLGATDDFDFNDIVIDVAEITEVTHHVSKTADGTIESDEVSGTKTYQKAWLRHLGGTLPFQLTIGDTELPEMQGQLGANPNTEYDITGWIPNANNIKIRVVQRDNLGVFTIVFPKRGEAPMIIAVDPGQSWMPERQSVPNSWFNE